MIANFKPLSLCMFTCLISVFSFSSYAAADDETLAACSAIDNDTARLSCYDDLLKTKEAPKTEASEQNKESSWITNSSADPLTDKSVYTAMLFASEGMNKYNREPAIIVRCKNNVTDMYIVWDAYLGRDDITTTYRIGKEKAITKSWSVSTDKKAAFFPTSPIGALKSLIDSEDQTFVAKVTPYNESPITAVFDSTGIEDALKDIRQGCNW